MAVRITYLLGAGASAEALPLIKKGNETKEGLPDALKRFLTKAQGIITDKNGDESLHKNLLRIAERCIEFGTPDLYAKFLIETGNNNEYNLLKRLLSNYFWYEQIEISSDFAQPGGPKFDKRALTFLTTISNNQQLPEDLNILSWNYDIQIEKAADRLANWMALPGSCIKNFTTWPNISVGETHSKKEPFLLHLNGVAGFNYSERDLCNEEITDWYDFKNLSNPSLLSFAWEDEPRHGRRTFLENRIERAKKMAVGTQVLVVIGYSFPFFNRIIDKQIFAAMKDTLSIIYFQDPYLDGTQLRAQFGLHQGFPVIHVKNVDNYYVPFEL